MNECRRCHIGWKAATGKHELNGHFNGTEAQIALANWDDLVDIAIPPTDGVPSEQNVIA